MQNKNLIVEIDNHVATVYFNRAQVLNALNRETLEELISVMSSLEQDNEIKVVILTGMGDKAFIAGADIAEMKDMDSVQAREFMEYGQTALFKIENMGKPVLAAVNGFALGGGAELALACDFIYASENAKFGFPEVTLGIFPGFGGTQRLPRLIGKAVAKELIFTGSIINAHEACEFGMVNKIFSEKSLMKTTKKLAKIMSQNSALAIKLAKATIDQGNDLDLTNGCILERNTVALCFSDPEQKKRMKDFLHKRKKKSKS